MRTSAAMICLRYKYVISHLSHLLQPVEAVLSRAQPLIGGGPQVAGKTTSNQAWAAALRNSSYYFSYNVPACALQLRILLASHVLLLFHTNPSAFPLPSSMGDINNLNPQLPPQSFPSLYRPLGLHLCISRLNLLWL